MTTSHNTRLFGVLAHPGGENLFHSMLAKAASATDADAAFLLFDFQAKDIADPVEALRRLRAGGAFLTGRLREAAGGLVDYLSDEAHGSGTINVITFDEDTATGHNTEALGIIDILTPFREKFANRSAVVLGAGSMARAAAYALVRHFRVRQVAIADRSPQRAQLLKQSMTGRKSDSSVTAYELFPPDIADVLTEARLIINATSVGTGVTEGETPVTLPDIFHPGQVIFDVVYDPAETELMRNATAAGATVLSGRDLLVKQVGKAFELLTDTPFPESVVRAESVAGTSEKKDSQSDDSSQS